MFMGEVKINNITESNHTDASIINARRCNLHCAAVFVNRVHYTFLGAQLFCRLFQTYTNIGT